MPGLPDDLRPLPTRPYAERPGNLPLEVEEIRTALWMHDGNVSLAAAEMRVTSLRLRTFIYSSPYLQREIREMQDRLVDMAEDNIREELTNPETKSAATRFVLDRLGKHRGWGNNAGGVKVDVNAGANIKFVWGDGQSLAEPEGDPKMIEGEVVK